MGRPSFSADIHHEVVRFEARSHGRSSTAMTDYRPDDDLEAVLDALDLRSAALVGCSMGGGTAVDFALTRPERTTGLVLIGSGINPMTFDDPFVLAQRGAQAEAIAAGDADGWVEALRRYGVDGPFRDPSDVPTAVRTRCRAMAIANVAAHYTATGTQIGRDAMASLEEIAAPTLIIQGEPDTSDVIRVADEAFRRMPKVRRRDLPKIGHVASMEAPGHGGRRRARSPRNARGSRLDRGHWIIAESGVEEVAPRVLRWLPQVLPHVGATP